jgi:hypothetical protein
MWSMTTGLGFQITAAVDAEAGHSSVRPLGWLANDFHKQQSQANETADTDHGITDSECQELDSSFGRLKGCQETKNAEGGNGEQEQRNEYGGK